MSKIKIGSILVGLALLTGCTWPTLSTTPGDDETTTNADAQTYWLDYALTQCNLAPWGKVTEPAIVTDYYSANITVFSIEVTPPVAGVMFCSACGCPTGTVVSVQTDAAGEIYLLEQGFTEAGTALETSTITGATTVAETIPATTATSTSPATTVVVDEPVVNSSDDTITAAADVITTTPVAAETIVEPEPELEVEPVIIADEPVSEADANLQDRAEQVQSALTEYYATHGSYPEDLTVLSLTIDLTSITYTPIGALPANYYDLAIAYTTGAEILNP